MDKFLSILMGSFVGLVLYAVAHMVNLSRYDDVCMKKCAPKSGEPVDSFTSFKVSCECSDKTYIGAE